MATKTLSSPLVSAFNNIGKLGTSAKMSSKLQSDFMGFLNFIEMQNAELNRIELPEERKIKRLANLNIASTFGSPGGLLSSLASGALDLAGFLGNFFPGRGKQGKPQPDKGVKTPKVTPRGKRLRFSGVKGLGVLNALFAGLDFYQGLQEGESVGKAATGAGASLAGSIIGGILGSPLGPLGSIAGATLGGMVAGWAGDRAYEAATGNNKNEIKQKQEQRLKEQERKQKALVSDKSFSDTLNKFSMAVQKFERGVAQGLFGTISESVDGEDVYGYSEELPPELAPKQPDQIDTGPVSYGSGNAEFGETGRVFNAKGWVHGHFQGTSPQSVNRDTMMVVKALLKQGSPVYLNQHRGGGVDLNPSRNYSDEELYKYIESARKAHTHSGTGNSIDVFVKKGTKVPVPLTNIGPTGSDYGGYGRGGLAGYIQGTTTWIGHLTPNSKTGISSVKGQIRGQMSPEVKDSQNKNNQLKQTQTKSQPQTKPQTQPQISQSPTMIPSIKPIQSNTSTSSNMRDIEETIQPAIQETNIPQQVNTIQYYPSYNQGQYITTIVPMLMGNNSSNQRPIVVSGGSAGSEVVLLPPPSEGEIVNDLLKTMLLTNLSGS